MQCGALGVARAWHDSSDATGACRWLLALCFDARSSLHSDVVLVVIAEVPRPCCSQDLLIAPADVSLVKS